MWQICQIYKKHANPFRICTPRLEYEHPLFYITNITNMQGICNKYTHPLCAYEKKYQIWNSMQNITFPDPAYQQRVGQVWENKNMTNILKYAKYAKYQILERYVFVTFCKFFSQHHLWFYVQVYTAVMQWTCLVCWLHTGSSCFCQVMHYTQFSADNLFVCAGHYETARQKSCCTHCILCLQAVSRLFSMLNHSLPKFMPTRNLYSNGNAASRANLWLIFEILFIISDPQTWHITNSIFLA